MKVHVRIKAETKTHTHTPTKWAIFEGIMLLTHYTDLLWDKHTQLNVREQGGNKSLHQGLCAWDTVMVTMANGWATVNSWRAFTFPRLSRYNVHRGSDNISGVQKLWKHRSRLIKDLLQNFSAELRPWGGWKQLKSNKKATASFYHFLVWTDETFLTWQEEPHYTGWIT